MKTKTLSVVLAITALACGLIIFRGKNQSAAVVPLKAHDEVRMAASKKPSEETPRQATRVIAAASPQPQKDPREVSENLKKKFGSGLEVALTSTGAFDSAVGNPERGLTTAKDFYPKSEEQARSRAKEILKEILSESGVLSAQNFDEGVVNTGEVSAQVFFRQTLDGVPVEPGGKFTVQLGSQGELLGAYADTAPSYETTGSFQRPPPAANSSKVYWVDSSSNPPKAIAAYQTYEKGHQIITDATTGAVIFQRDRRIF